MKFRTLYPTGTSRAAGQLVRGRATIHYEEFGRADGVPALFLHGGPGAGCFPRHASFFDPSHYRVLLLDQRGCGRSTPRGDLDQDTATLVADLEALREHLSLPAWGVVLGGSWGTTLALAYAQAHPQRVRALVLRAVCLMREREIRWLFAAGGMADLAPTAWSRFAAHGDDGGGDRGPDGVLRRYAEALAGADGPARNSAASAWMSWEGAVGGTGARLPACPPPRDADDDGAAPADAGASWEWRPLERRWAHGAAALSTAGVRAALTDGWRPRVRAAVGVAAATPRPPPPPPPRRRERPGGDDADGDGDAAAGWTPSAKWWAERSGQKLLAARTSATSSWVPSQPLLTCFYSSHRGFLGDDQLLKGCRRLRHIPCVAVQGANDLICPPSTALELHDAWPEMHLRVAPGAGHSMYDPALTHEVVEATDALRDWQKASGEES